MGFNHKSRMGKVSCFIPHWLQVGIITQLANDLVNMNGKLQVIFTIMYSICLICDSTLHLGALGLLVRSVIYLEAWRCFRNFGKGLKERGV